MFLFSLLLAASSPLLSSALTVATHPRSRRSNSLFATVSKEPTLSTVSTPLFIELGWGNDSHGQSSTKAAVRAARNAIEYNSIPSVAKIVPGGYEKMKLDVLLAVPSKYQDDLDERAVAEVFPYGKVNIQIQDGGMVAPSGIAIDELGDTSQDMVVVCCSVTVGY